MARLYLETLQKSPVNAPKLLAREKRELDAQWTKGEAGAKGRRALRRRYVAGVKRLDELHVALGGEAGRYVPLDPDTRPMALDR